MPGLRKGRCQRSWRAARQKERRMAFLTFLCRRPDDEYEWFVSEEEYPVGLVPGVVRDCFFLLLPLGKRSPGH